MSTRLIQRILPLSLAFTPIAGAGDVFKANPATPIALNQPGSWVSGGPPGSGDVAVWDSTVTTSNNYTMGASLSWAGLKVLSPGLDPTIRPTTGQTLTLGASGIDMSAATRNFTLNPVLVVGANQTWNVASTFTLNAAALTGSGVTLVKSGGGTLKLTGATTYAGGLTLSGGILESSNASGIQELSGALGGSGTLNKTGAGILTLSGNNAGYSGPINLSAGQLNLNHASAPGTGTLTISGGVLDNTSGVPVTLANNNPQNWNGDFTCLGSNNLNLGSGAVTLSANRTVTVSSNTLTVGGAITGTASLTKTGAGTLALSGDNSFSGNLTNSGTGSMVISGTNTYAGTTVVSGGTLTVSGGSIPSTSYVSVAGAGTPVFNLTGGNVNVTTNIGLFIGTSTPGSATISGGTFTSAAADTQIVVGDAAVGTYNQTGGSVSGGSAGLLWIANNAGGSGSTLSISGGSLSIGGGGVWGVRGSYVVTISGTAQVTSGQIWLGHTGGTTNNPTGRITNLDGGTLKLAGGIAYQAGTAVINLNGGTLQAASSSNAFWNNSANVTTNVRAGGAIIELDGYSVTIAQPLLHEAALGSSPDGGLLVKDDLGGGGLTLKGACTYTGPTTIQAGSLVLDTGGSISASPVIDVQAAGTLDAISGTTIASGQTLQGTGTLLGNLTIGVGGNLSPGGNSIGTLTALESLTLAGTSVLQIDKTGAVLTKDAVLGLNQLNYGGTLTVTATGSTLANGDSFKLFDATTYAGNFATINLPTLAAGLYWETSTLKVDGTIRVVNSVPVPTFSPLPGRYATSPSVTIASAAGSTIHYTTDGSNPVTSGTAIAGPSPLAGVVVPANNLAFTIKAYATKSGASDSAVATAVYNTVGTSTWILDGVGTWSDSVNWLNSLIADGSGITADFSTLTLTADSTAVLDGSRMIGGLKFGDVGNVYNWLVDGSSSDVLTLDSGANTPVATVVNQTATITVPLTGSHGMTKDGAGALVLIGANSITGNTSINAGTLQLGTGTTNGSFGAGNYPIASGGKLYLNYATAVQSSNGSWTNKVRGAGTLELKSAQGANGGANWGPNSPSAVPFDPGFTGTLQLDNGRLDSAPAGLGGISNIIIKDGAQFLAWSGSYTLPISIAGNGWGESGYPGGLRLAADSTATWAGSVTLTADAGINMQRNGTFTITGSITGNYLCDFHCGSPIGSTTGTLLIAPAAAVQNSYGSTKITGVGGTTAIAAGNAYAFSTGGLEMTSGGTLQLNGFNFSFANLKGAAGTIGNYHASNASVITVGSDNSDTSFSGSLVNGAAATLGLTKTGAGNLTLATAQTYTGSTTVNAGTLTVNGSLASASPVTVSSGGTLAGIGSVNGSISVPGGGSLAPGDNGVGTLAVGATTLAGTYQCQVSGATTDKITVTGNLNLTGSTLGVSTIGTATPGTYVIATYTGSLTGTFASVTPGNSVDYSTPNQVKLVVTASGDPYQTWASGFGLSGNNALASADPDKDGIANSVEFVIGGNPASVANQSLLPTVALVTNPGGTVPNGDYLRFTYRRTPASAYLNPDMQFDADLIGTWTTATGAPGVVQVVTPNFYASPTAADRVEVFVPRAGNAVNGKLFGRLRVITP